MDKLTISIFGNQIFSEIVNELKLFSKYKLKFYDNLDLCTKDAMEHDQIVIFCITKTDNKYLKQIVNYSFPLIIIANFSLSRNFLSSEFTEQLNTPFRVLDLEKKIVSLEARYKFKKRSLINLCGYIIDKNQRKIKKNNLILQLTEKEINFLFLFKQNNKPLSKNFILKNVWNYSSKSDTHTVETHIHRLRKKFLEKFKDNNFIKNNDKGYYI